MSALAFLLLWPKQWFATAIKDPVERWPLAIAVVSISGLCAYPVSWLGEGIARQVRERKELAHTEKTLNALGAEEKAVLRGAFADGRSQTANLTGLAEVFSLVDQNILIRVTPMVPSGRSDSLVGYRIDERARKLIRQDPRILN